MKLGPHTTAFIEGALDATLPVISKVKPTKEMNDQIWRRLFGESSQSPNRAPLNREDLHVMKLFWIFSEIHGCIERLKDCETYVGRFPFSRTRVSRAAYLQFVVEGHLHEMYLLRERLEILAKTVGRLFKRDKKAKHIARVTDMLIKYATRGLSGFTNVRGAHVHQWRYSHADIDRLQLISTLRKPKRSPFARSLRSLERIANAESHERLRRQSRRWNSEVSRILEGFFEHLNPIVFTQDRKAFALPVENKI